MAQSTSSGETFEVSGAEDCLTVLNLALSDWTDFLFTPDPPTVQIYADHDEFITFFPIDLATLRKLTDVLVGAGFSRVKYERVVEDLGYR